MEKGRDGPGPDTSPMHERIDGKPGTTQNGKMIQQALQALGESVDARIIGSGDSAGRPLWTNAEEKRQIDALAERAFEDMMMTLDVGTVASRIGFAADHLGRTTFMGVRLTTPEDIAADTYPYVQAN